MRYKNMITLGCCLLAGLANVRNPGAEVQKEVPSLAIGVLPAGEEPPKIDGIIQDNEWKSAAVIGDFVVSGPGKAEPARNRTQAYLLRDSRVLYVGAKCYDSDMKNLSGKDWFELFLADNNLLIYYHFWIHPSGETNRDGSPGVFLFQAPQWTAKVSLHGDCWHAEMAIPFYNFSPDYMEGPAWRLNLCREKYSEPAENTQWSNTGGYFHVPELFGRVTGVQGIDYTPSVDVAAAITKEDVSAYVLPDFALLDRSYYTREEEAGVKICLKPETAVQAEGGQAVVNVRTSGGKSICRVEKPWPGKNPAYFSFSIAGMPAGVYAADVAVRNGGREIAAFQLELVKLEPGETEIKVNRFTRMLLVDGKPFIPLICAARFRNGRLDAGEVPEDGLQIAARESGFNTLCLWGQYDKANVEACRKAGMHLVLFPQVTWEKTGPALTDALIEEFKSYREYPNVLAWFLADEGNLGGNESEFKRRFGLLRAADPYRPIFRNDGSWTIGYGGPGGLETTDIYLGGYGGYRLLDQINVDAMQRGKPSLTLANWMMPPESVRLPTPAETVSWLYQELVHGGCGGFWWGIMGVRPPVPGLWEALRQLRRETEALAPVLNTVEPEARAACDNKDIHFIVREYEGDTYLVSVNVSGKKQTAAFALDKKFHPAAGTVEVLFDNAKFSYAGWQLKAEYDGLQRRVFKFRSKVLPERK